MGSAGGSLSQTLSGWVFSGLTAAAWLGLALCPRCLGGRGLTVLPGLCSQ